MTPSTLPTPADAAVPSDAVAIETDSAAVDPSAAPTSDASVDSATAAAEAAPTPKFATLPGVGFVGETCGIDGC